MKSHVSMEQHQCPICLTTFDTGNILLDQHLRERFEHQTLTGYSPCPQCEQKLADGYIALVETAGTRDGHTASLDVPRSGNLCFVKRDIFPQIFNIPAPPEDHPPMVFIEPGVIQQLQAMTEGAQETHH